MNGHYNNLLIQASNEALLLIKDGTILTCNPFAAQLFGYDCHALTGKKVTALFDPLDKKTLQDAMGQMANISCELTAKKKDLTPIVTQVTFRQVTEGNEKFVALAVRDLTEIKRAEKKLMERDALLESIGYTAARFLESEDWRSEIRGVLQNIGQAAQVSRVYIFQNFRDEVGKLYMSQQYEWVADHVKPQIENPFLERLYYFDNGLEGLVEILSKGKIYKGLVKDLPAKERNLLEAQDIQSIVLTPVFKGGQWWGFLGYDECHHEREWNTNEIQLLNTVADIFTSALEREKIEEKLSGINRNFKSLFHHSPDGIYVYDYNGYVLDVNKAGCRINGLERGQVIGKHVSDLVPEVNRDQVSDNFRYWTLGKYSRIEAVSKNYLGETIPVEIIGTRITFSDKPAVLLVTRDISNRKKSEDQLKKRIEFIEFISQISSEFIKIDLENMEQAVNKALQFVCKYGSIERGYVFRINEPETMMVLTNEYCDPAYKPHKGILDSIRIDDFKEFIDTLKSGEYIISHFDEIPDDDENVALRRILELLEIKSFINIPLIVDGHFLGYIGFDSTTRKTSWNPDIINTFMLTGQMIANTIIRKKNEDDLIEAKNKAEQSDRLKSAFLGQMSHEMRTPLNSIIGFAEMLERELENNELGEMASYIVQGGNRLLTTFNLVIDLSEIEANAMQAKMEDIELNHFVERMMPVFTNRASEKQLDMKFIPKRPGIKILADENLFEKVVYNVVDNALKYTRKGSINLVTNVEKNGRREFAVLKVIDTGIGIENEKIQDIFSKFRQASEGYNREFEGSGLGLSVTKGLVQLMDGEILVKSTPGKGSEFTIRFPLTTNSPDLETVTKHKEVNVLNNLPQILVVEDEVVHQKFISYILKDEYELVFAKNGPEALDLANRKKFDLIIMDINLGKNMNGMETIGKIRNMTDYAHIPAIAATANVMKGHKELFLSKGFTHYLAKPYRAQDMKSLVEEILFGEKSITT